MTVPKIIHYVWIGTNKKTKLVEKCIKTWKKYCPDYEIMEWGNEILSEIDNKYVSEAFAAKKWAFVSDYIRLYVLKKYGGVYMDTDVELVKPIDEFVDENDFFLGFENWRGIINIGTGLIGAVKENKIISDLLDEYEHISFIKPDGAMDLTPNPQRFCSYLETNYEVGNLHIGTTTVELDEKSKIYPWWYFCKPKEGVESFAIHHFAASWIDSSSKTKSISQNLFSVKNSFDKKHKILTILGLKLKFKRKLKISQSENFGIAGEVLPKVSVVIPVYNSQETLVSTLNSVINQTLKEIEIICVNDGSTDNSMDILRKFAQKDARIIIIDNPKNEGPGKARNDAIDIVKGEYIGFLDSDDFIDADFYEKMYNAAQKTNSDIACASIYKPDESLFYLQVKEERVCKKVYDKYRFSKVPKWCYIMNKIYKTSKIKKHKCYFKTGVYYEDMLWSFRTLYFLGKMVMVPNVTYHYLFNPNSIVWQTSDKHRNDYLLALDDIQEFIIKHNVKCPICYLKWYHRYFIRICGLKILRIDEYKFAKRYYLFDKILISESRKIGNKDLRLKLVDVEDL